MERGPLSALPRAGMRQHRVTSVVLAVLVVVSAVFWTATAAHAAQAASPAAPVDEQDTPPVDMIPLAPEDVREMARKARPSPPPVPAELMGKIIFLSDLSIPDMEGVEDCRKYPDFCDAHAGIFAIDPVTGDIWQLTDPWLYQCAVQRDAFSANRHYQAFVDNSDWIEVSSSEYGYLDHVRQYQVKYYDRQFGVVRTLSHFGAMGYGEYAYSGNAWDPVWSPAGDFVAFVSNESGSDEIYTVAKDRWPPQQLTRDPWAWDKHPSWSPDGRQIVFESNRDGQRRLWLMNADGSNQRPLTDSMFSAWAPVWVKYVGADGCP